MKIFITSDHHFFHKNIIRYENRPFDDLDAMHSFMIKQWNSVVYPHDLVYHLGDFAFASKKEIAETVSLLNGRKILIRGNHDKHGLFFYLNYFDVVTDLVVLNNVLMSHKPVYDHKYKLNIHGHTHSKLVTDLRPELTNKFFNISVENHNYLPLSLHRVIRHAN